MEPKAVGQTAHSGYEIGVRRVLPRAAEAVWEVLLSPAGLTTWLGGPVELREGAAYRLANGTCGAIKVWKPGSHIRLTWQPRDWVQPSTLQLRVLPAKHGTTVSFHQEQLSGAAARTLMQAHWEQVLVELAKLLAPAGPGPREG